MFKAKKPGIIVICDENLSFIAADKHNGWQCIESFPVSGFLDKDISIDIPQRKFRGYDFALMIVPDFWFGNRTHDFQSKDKAVIEAYIARKLKLEFPKNPEIQNLFTYKVIKNDGKQELASLFLQEPIAGALFQNLAQYNIHPVRISSPALLWNQRLETLVDSFEESGTGLIYLLRNECFMLFYYLGNFLFSRTIRLPEIEEDNSSRYKSLSFEINQSAYHFSQRTKTQLDEIFLISRANDNTDEIRESLGRDIHPIDKNNSRRDSNDKFVEELGIASDFAPDDLFPVKKVPGISDRILEKGLEARKIQLVGIIIGLVLCLFLGSEYLFLNNMKHREALTDQVSGKNPKQIISQYSDALDMLLIDSERKKPLSVIGCLAASLPEDLMVESIEVELDPVHSIFLRGSISTKDIDEFGALLREMVKNLNNNFNTLNPLSIDDVEINMNGQQTADDKKKYAVSFSMELT